MEGRTNKPWQLSTDLHTPPGLRLPHMTPPRQAAPGGTRRQQMLAALVSHFTLTRNTSEDR